MTSTARTYADRLADALAERYGEAVTVTNSQGMLVLQRGNARATAMPTGRDKRRAVTADDVDAVAAGAASRLARDISHFRPEFVAPARELVAILRGDVCPGCGVGAPWDHKPGCPDDPDHM